MLQLHQVQNALFWCRVYLEVCQPESAARINTAKLAAREVLAFTAAFDVLDSSAQSEIGSSACRIVVLLMFDGDPTDSAGTNALNVLRSRTATAAG